MKKVKKLYLIATVFFGLLCGLGHLMTEFFAPKDPDVINTLKSIQLEMPGKESDLFSLMFGISVSLGVLLISYGLFNLFILRLIQFDALKMKSAIYLNLFVVLICFLIGLKFLFIAPVVLMGISFSCFVFAAALVNREK